MREAPPSFLPLTHLIQWYRSQNRQLPWRTHWLNTKDPYGVWVSEVMLQQTLIKVVIPAYLKFIERFPTIRHLAEASEEELREAVRGLGYYRRFRMMHECAKHLVTNQKFEQRKNQPVADHRQLWPKNAAELQKLPGIGTYTSAAIGSIAFGEKVAVVDGNVERVLCRLEGMFVQPKDPKIKKQLSKIAQEYLENALGADGPLSATQKATLPGDYNQAMMELGQLVCTPLQPHCHRCPLANQCQAYQRGHQEQIPLPIVRKAPLPIFFSLRIVLKTEGDKVLVALFRRGSQARFLKESWGFLSEWSDLSSPASLARGAASPFDLEFLGGFRHSITHHRLSVEVFTRRASSLGHLDNQGWHRDSLAHEQQWVSQELVEPQLVANLDRKAWKIFQKNLIADKLEGGRSSRLTAVRRGGLPLLHSSGGSV